MSRKARMAAQEPASEPATGGPLDLALVATAAIVVALVGVLFKLDVNRVFDVPKALVLKVGGGGIFLVWLLYGLFGAGWPWRSIRLFVAPVAALLGSVILSTLLSIDPQMSLYGVYERQFGLQGFLGCVGLFVVMSTALRSRRGAFAALAVLTVVGGAIGSYAFLQARGHDPFGFFTKPHDKTYSFLGNATFAGNALALIFPISTALAVIAAVRVLRPAASTSESAPRPPTAAYLAGVVGALALALLPGYGVASGSKSEGAASIYTLVLGASLLLPVAFALLGSQGPEEIRLASPSARRTLDALAAAALAAGTLEIAVGLVCTRTRGAWVGTALAVLAGALLLPKLFRDVPEVAKKVRAVTWGLSAALVLGVGGLMLLFPNHVWSETIKSIPKAFDPQKQVLGRGQGTRPYLWSESPRVLVDHGSTLDRQFKDLAEAAEKLKPALLQPLQIAVTAPTEAEQKLERSWRLPMVWLTGIGIETYRYAFMSHKSKKLESLDPMTNHDNPHNNYLYVLASFGILGLGAYLWLLARLLGVAYRRFSGADGREDDLASRALAFGLVTSFFSYAFYSIAGFDSVACSVFFYYLLGAAAAYLEPAGDEPRRNILVQGRRQWDEFRGRTRETVGRAPVWASAGLALGLGGLLLHTILAGYRVHEAERAFVGDTVGRRDFQEKIEDIEAAIRINPYESFYKQSLGSTWLDGVRQLRNQANRLQAAGRAEEAKLALARADEFAKKAEAAFYAGLDHAWAPENIFISLFQLYYTTGRLAEAELALERALEHSPHLGAVRANLAILELERGAHEEALADCKWVLEVEPYSAIALRTCGRANFLLGRLADAEHYLERAASAAPSDNVVKNYMAEVRRARETETATAGSAG